MSGGGKVMLGLGAALIVAMMLVAAFSVGVYVGRHSWTDEGLSLAGPAPQQGQPPAAGPEGGVQLPPRTPDLVGRVQAVDGPSLRLATPQGPRDVELLAETRVATAGGQRAGLEALRPGIVVAIFGHRGASGHTLEADLVVILNGRSGEAPAMPVPGDGQGGPFGWTPPLETPSPGGR